MARNPRDSLEQCSERVRGVRSTNAAEGTGHIFLEQDLRVPWGELRERRPVRTAALTAATTGSTRCTARPQSTRLKERGGARYQVGDKSEPLGI